ncbi:hypothetical protein A3Q56_06506, partial [Intoshia linei]
MSGRGSLLNQIQKGKKLAPSAHKTKDTSAPVISSSAGNGGGGGGGGLFPNGIPALGSNRG